MFKRRYTTIARGYMKVVPLFRTIIWNFLFWVIMIFSQLFMPILFLLTKMGKIDTRSRFVSALAHWWTDVLIRLSGSKLEIIGEENIPDDHSYCIISNHQGFFDIPVIIRTIPWTVGFIAKKELAKVPLLSMWMKVIGVVFLDRSDRRAAIKVMQTASEKIKCGHPMVIFPEGTRSKGGPVAPFKQASLKLATLARTKIIPITVNNTYEIIEGKEKGINPANITVHVHPVIDIETLSDEEVSNLSETLRNIIIAPLESMNK